MTAGRSDPRGKQVVPGIIKHYTGRRVFRPTDVHSVNAVLAVTATRDTMTLVAGSKISQWNTLVGSHNGTQGTDALRPTYSASGGPNNLPYVAFNAAASAVLNFGDFSALTAGEFFAVRRVGADPPVSGIGNWYDFSGGASTDHDPFTDGLCYDGFGSTTRKNCGDSTVDLSTWHIINAHSVTNDWGIRFNGISLFTTAGNTVGFPATCQIGGTTDGGITEFWLFDGKLTAWEREGMLAYLNLRNRLGLKF